MAGLWPGGFTGREREILCLSIRNLITQSISRVRSNSCTVMLRTVQPREHKRFQQGGGEEDGVDIWDLVEGGGLESQ